jgi:putative glycerol-1-phosphate prenyltransferase
MVYNALLSDNRLSGSFALLIDPDKHTLESVGSIARQAELAEVDVILLGGSLIRNNMVKVMAEIRKSTSLPIVLFPGSVVQFCSEADAILLLSLISGRNPDYLIGSHVQVANAIKDSGMEVIPTGYMLIDSGDTTSVQYMSNTMPIPACKTDIAVATALAGQQLGLKAIYLEAGSGAKNSVPVELICEVRKNLEIPIIVGGGLRSPEQVRAVRDAGAKMVVVGSIVEKNSGTLLELVKASR